MIQVHSECPLTVPNLFHITSSCGSNTGGAEYTVNITHLHDAAPNDLITIDHPLLPGKHNCSLSVRGGGGHTELLDTGQSEPQFCIIMHPYHPLSLPLLIISPLVVGLLCCGGVCFHNALMILHSI